MNKAIGFSLAYDKEPPCPGWLADFPWLGEFVYERNGWAVRLWGHGDLSSFIHDSRIIVGYSDTDMKMRPLQPLQNRGVIIELGEEATITNDFAGYLPVFYAPGMASTDEQCLRGELTLDPVRVISLLLSNTLLAGATIWREIDWLYGNSILTLTNTDSMVVKWQKPLRLRESRVEDMADMLEKTIRRYTDPLDKVYLSLSSGYDSRLIMLNMERPERIKARTYPISRPAKRSCEYAIAHSSAELAGVEDHKWVSAWNYGKYPPMIFGFYGPTFSAVNSYVCAFIIRANEKERLPMLHGMPGDTLSGNPVYGDMKKVAWRWDDAGRFEQLCRIDPHSWKTEELNQLLDFDWQHEFAQIRPVWGNLWRKTEGYRVPQRADILRLRNRSALMTVRTFAIADAYGGMISPYCDREYTEYMLSLPDEARLGRSAQKAMAKEKWPDHFNLPKPLSASQWDTDNTIDADNISKAAMWPSEQLEHPFFRKAYVEELRQRALDGDVHSFWLLWPLQTIAYGLMNDYPRRH